MPGQHRRGRERLKARGRRKTAGLGETIAKSKKSKFEKGKGEPGASPLCANDPNPKSRQKQKNAKTILEKKKGGHQKKLYKKDENGNKSKNKTNKPDRNPTAKDPKKKKSKDPTYDTREPKKKAHLQKRKGGE